MATDYSIHTGKIREFGSADYVVFILLLIVSAAIGVFYAVKDKVQKKENTTEFLLGGRSMPAVLAGVSISVTNFSSSSMLGIPRDIYLYNTMYIYFNLGMALSLIFSALVFTPFFYNLGITSTSQYVDLRFGKSVRNLITLILIIAQSLYHAFLLYAPALALSAVTGIDLWGAVITMGVIATLYTTLGGIKAVIWTDVFQWCVIAAGMLAILIKGSMVSGGFSNAWDKAVERGRVVFDDFSTDPRGRHTFWSTVIGGMIFWLSIVGVNQSALQRALSTSSVRNARISMLSSILFLTIVFLITFLAGITMFDFYSECYPDKLITKTDQLLPLYVMDILGDVKGVPGLFVACLFSGSLSSYSSGLNALSTVTFKDFVEPVFGARLTEFKATIINKILVVLYGLLGIGIAFLLDRVDGVLQVSITFAGVTGGPMLGVFCLAMFFPCANRKGAIVGLLVATGIMSWIMACASMYKIKTAVAQPVVTTECVWYQNVTSTNLAVNNFTTPSMMTTTSMTSVVSGVSTIAQMTTAASNSTGPSGPTSYKGIMGLYAISYFYYTPLGLIITLVVGMCVSFATGPTKAKNLDPRLVCNVFDILFPFLPEVILKPLRFGVIHKGKYNAPTVIDAQELKIVQEPLTVA